jgi:ADP-ribose pyrophosphatase
MPDFPIAFQTVPCDSIDEKHLFERGISRSSYQGQFLRFECDQVRLPDGHIAVREYIAHTGAVMIIPLLEDGRLILERQFRYAVSRVLIEFPAGKLDPNETSLECAQRELKEETGYTATEWAFASLIHPVGPYSSEHIDIWFARGLISGERQLDEGEFLDVFAASLEDLQIWISTGIVTDAKTIIGAVWIQNVRHGLWDLKWLPADSPMQPIPAGPCLPALG